MEFQLHPASPRGSVRRLALLARGERIATASAGVAAVLAVSLGITVPTLARRTLREESEAALRSELAESLSARRELGARAAGTRDRALDAGDRINRIAFLYGVPPGRWPRGLSPEAGLIAGSDPARLVSGCDRYLAALERGRSLIESAERGDPDLAARTPSRLPVRSDLVEPSAVFGPRVSPWTASEEFFPGVDLAAPPGSEVIAAAAGSVLFAGKATAAPVPRLARFGNVVVLRHGAAGVTVYGHLARVDVRRGQRVAPGQRLGTVGSSGWAVSPALHYEYWRELGGRLSATDPRFAILDRRLGPADASLELMRATSAPASIEPPPAR